MFFWFVHGLFMVCSRFVLVMFMFRAMFMFRVIFMFMFRVMFK